MYTVGAIATVAAKGSGTFGGCGSKVMDFQKTMAQAYKNRALKIVSKCIAAVRREVPDFL
ncbi:MAG TPA: hypothetical protein VIT92_09550 [Burkholderiaceae bacterium]